MIPLGLYLPGESSPLPDPRTLASAGINTVWLTHCLDDSALSTPATLEYARQCAAAGLRLVAAPSALHISGPTQGWKRTQDYYNHVIPATLAVWGTTPRPLAWCLGDEPIEVDAYRDFVATWRRLLPREPVTAVVTRGYLDSFRAMGFDIVAHDSYQFLEPGVRGDEDGQLGSWIHTCGQNAGGWAMGQGFSKPRDKRIPTPAEVSWQIYSALACGCRGVFLFAWAAEPGPEQLTTLAQLPDQFAAMGSAYRRAGAWSVLETATHHGWQPLPGPDGSGYGTFTGADGSRYVLAVCGPGAGGAGATLAVPTGGWLAQEVGSRWPVVAWRGVLSVRMQAGEGRLWRVR